MIAPVTASEEARAQDENLRDAAARRGPPAAGRPRRVVGRGTRRATAGDPEVRLGIAPPERVRAP